MKRVLVIALGTAVLVVGVLAALGAGGEGSDNPRFTVVFDNAFGLIEGADVKVAGVRAGKITSLEVDRESYRALVGIEITAEGYGDLRTDVFCETRPQSLIGEYFVDCLPGEAEGKIEPGSQIPVEQTGSTVPADLLNNIWRRPTRERFSILIGELGAALAGRGEDLNETIRRANPALRETDKVLAVLAEQRNTIRDLTATAEDVVTRLADNRQDISRFIAEARDTAEVSAVRQEELRAQFQRFPVFLRELRPTMRLLGRTADSQAPALATLAEQAPLLTTFLDTLGPFSEASRPAMRTLAGAARAGRPAIEAATPRVDELREFADGLPQVADNLDITLNHLHDRDFAAEQDPRSPGGKGFTGFEAVARYIFNQSQATNVYDANSYLLKVAAFLDNNCAQYADAATARRPDRQYCRAILGPNQPGIDDPDPTATTQTRRSGRGDGEDDPAATPTPEATPETPLEEVLEEITEPSPVATVAPGSAIEDVLGPIRDITDALPALPQVGKLDSDVGPLLDFLVGP